MGRGVLGGIGRLASGVQGVQSQIASMNPFAGVAGGPWSGVTSDQLPGDARAAPQPTSTPPMAAINPVSETAAPDAAQDRFVVGSKPNRPIGQPRSGQSYKEFMDAVKTGGLTNPYGLAAVAATGQHESGWNDKNIFGKWNDPSEKGVSGTSGGAMSWREDRYRAMQRFVSARGGDSARAQGEFFLQENPGLVAALNKAKSPDEAQRLMNNAWKFAGYNRQGGEASRRIQTARAKAAEFGGSNDPGVPLTSPMSTEMAYVPTTTTGVLARGTEFPTAPPVPTSRPQGGGSSGGINVASGEETTSPDPASAPQTPIAQAVEQWKVNKTTRRMRGLGPGATIGVLTAIGQMEREEKERALSGQPRVA